VLVTSAKVARGVIKDWTSRKHEEHWQSIHGQRQAKGFLRGKKTSANETGDMLVLSRNQLRILTGTQVFRRTPICAGAGKRFSSVIDANRHLKQPDVFFVTVRLWPH
jgi:hypothetical protein